MKQQTVNLPSGTYLIQEVNKSARGFVMQELVLGNWQLLGADPVNLTEEEAGEIVESWPSVSGDARVFQTYPDEIPKSRTASASLDSLAASLGISKPYCVLKNK